MDTFRRPHHNAVFAALQALDGPLLVEARCYFAGGTAIVLRLDEYRESVDIDFLCASQEGYRALRSTVSERGFAGLVKPGATLEALRDVRTDQYGIRTFVEVEGTRIKFEIVREARIALSGAIDAQYGVPVLDREDMYAEKLLANADRWADRSVWNRDVIDLSVMIARWGKISEAAWTKARDAYGASVDDAYNKAVSQIRNPAWLTECMRALQMESSWGAEILSLHGGPLRSAPQD